MRPGSPDKDLRAEAVEWFVLLDGEWFEIGAEYVRTSRHPIVRLFPDVPYVTLPAWSPPSLRTNRAYNEYVAARFPEQFLCLDRNQEMRSPLGTRSSLEVCDICDSCACQRSHL